MDVLLTFVLLEVMADALGADNNQEYVEFALNTSAINLTNTTLLIADSTSNDTLEYVTTLNPKNTTNTSNQSEALEYLLVVEEGYNYSQLQTNETCHIYSAGATIGNGLHNEADTVTLLFENQSLSHNYTISGCAAGENCSLYLQNDSFVPAPPTPCTARTIPTNDTNTTPACPLNLSIDAPTLLELGEAFRFTPTIIGTNYTLTYWWEDLYGTTLRDPTTTTNDNPKQFTPQQPANERDFALILYAELDNQCNTTSASHLAVVRGEEQTQTKEPESSGSSSTSWSAPQPFFAFSTPKSSYGNFSVVTTLYYPDASAEFQIATYAYRGSTNYSTRAPINITVNDLAVYEKHFSLEPGNYSVKTQVWYPGRKTPEEDRRSITVLETPVRKVLVEQKIEERAEQNMLTGATIAEEKTQVQIPWVGIVLAAALLVIASLRQIAAFYFQKRRLQRENHQAQSQEKTSQKNTTLHTWFAKEKSH